MIADLLSKFPGFISHTWTEKPTSLHDLILHKSTSNYEVEAATRIHFSLCTLSTLCALVCVPLRLFEHTAEWETDYLLMHIWQHLVGPFLCCHFWLLFSLSPRREQSRGGLRAATSAVPSSPNFCCPALWNLNLMQNQRMVIHVQQVPVPWKPPFPPQNIPFYPFWRAVTGKTRHHTTPGQAMTKPIFCLLVDWLKKTF